LHYDETIEALVQILIDFLKVLRFHSYQSFLAALQFEFSSSNRVQKSSNSFYLAYDFCKSLNSCQICFAIRAFYFAYDSCNMNFAFVLDDRFIEKNNQRDEFIKRKLTKLKKNNQRDEFIKRKMTKLNCFYDIKLWESFQEEFVNWTRRDFELTSIFCCRAFRIYLRRKKVWIWIFKETTFAKSLYDAFKKKTLTSWTEDEIRRCLFEMRFTFYLINELLKALSDELL
jgi:hypothetical protein